jgi:chaperonin GroES
VPPAGGRVGGREAETKEQQTSEGGEAVRMIIKPLGDRILVEPMEQSEVKKGGIIIPDSAKEKPQEGKVIAVGTGKRDEKGVLIPFNVKKGDKVLMPKYGGSEIKIDDKQYQIVREDDLLGIIE